MVLGSVLLGKLLIGAAIGAGIAVGTTMAANAIMGNPLHYGIGKAFVIGALSGAVSAGIGSWAEGIKAGKFLFQAWAHGVSGGVFAELGGGDFASGFAAGFVSSLVSSGVQSLGNLGKEVMVLEDLPGEKLTLTSTFGTRNKAIMDALTISAGGLSGGLSASISGGKFWDGARQGVIVAGLNHLHSNKSGASPERELRKQIRKSGRNPNGYMPNNEAELTSLANDVPMVNEYYKNAGSPKLSISNTDYLSGDSFLQSGVEYDYTLDGSNPPMMTSIDVRASSLSISVNKAATYYKAATEIIFKSYFLTNNYNGRIPNLILNEFNNLARYNKNHNGGNSLIGPEDTFGRSRKEATINSFMKSTDFNSLKSIFPW